MAKRFPGDQRGRINSHTPAMRVHELHRQNRELEEARNQFRASVYSLMAQHNTVTDDGGWAVFNVDAPQNSSETNFQPYQVLICVGRTPRLPANPQALNSFTIHIVKNELITSDIPPYTKQWLVQDFFMDPIGRTAYMTSAAELVPSRGGPEDDYTFVFEVENPGELAIPRLEWSLDGTYLGRPIIANDKEIYPFGRRGGIDDQRDNLAFGRALFNEICALTPSYKREF